MFPATYIVERVIEASTTTAFLNAATAGGKTVTGANRWEEPFVMLTAFSVAKSDAFFSALKQGSGGKISAQPGVGCDPRGTSAAPRGDSER